MSLSQSNDPELSLLLHWLDGEAEPGEGDLFLAILVVIHYFTNRSPFRLDENRLFLEKTGER